MTGASRLILETFRSVGEQEGSANSWPNHGKIGRRDEAGIPTGPGLGRRSVDRLRTFRRRRWKPAPRVPIKTVGG